MRGRFIEALIIIAVAVVAFLAIYYQQPPPKNPQPPALEKPQVEDLKAEVPKVEADAAMYSVNVTPQTTVRVGILGESRTDVKEEVFNVKVLGQLLNVLQKQNIDAIFFTGNLVSGTAARKNASEASPGTNEAEKESLAGQLTAFLSYYQSVLGDQVPFFPLMGDREIEDERSVHQFQEIFKLDQTYSFDEKTFGYTVALGEAFFAVIATDTYNSVDKKIERAFTAPMRAWLNEVLQLASKKYKYFFVVGHEPVFSGQSTFLSMQTGEEAFWKILVDNNVTAYFASHELLFDRSQRRGVWQIISGGGGALFELAGDKKPFFHALLLTIPADSKTVPFIEVLDEHGNIGDSFELVTPHSPIYQMHISSN